MVIEIILFSTLRMKLSFLLIIENGLKNHSETFFFIFSIMASPGDEEGLYSMSKHHRNVLNQCRTYLIRNLDVKPIIDVFITKELLSSHQEEELMVYRTNSELVRNFCNTLTRLGPTAFLSFLDALTKTNQSYIREYLESIDAVSDSGCPRQPGSIGNRIMTEEQGDSCIREPVKSVNDFVITNDTIQLQKTERHDCYRVRGGKYVHVAMINNITFEENTNLSRRDGSTQDVEILTDLFSAYLNFEVKIDSDLTAAGILKYLTEFSKETNLQEADACIVVIMSHGENGLILGTDGMRITIREIMELFSAENCKSLIEKPKYFIFQSCRGEHRDFGVNYTDAATSEPSAAPIDTQVLKSNPSSLRKNIPNMVDTLVSYSTLPSYVSYRNSLNGSWFINALCTVFKKHAARYDVMKMLSYVTNELVEKYGDSYVQLCEHTTRLRRDFYLTG